MARMHLMRVPADDLAAGLPEHTMKRSSTPASRPAGEQRMRIARPALTCRAVKDFAQAQQELQGCRTQRLQVQPACPVLHQAVPMVMYLHCLSFHETQPAQFCHCAAGRGHPASSRPSS